MAVTRLPPVVIDPPIMNRREFLALAGVTGASGSLAGCLDGVLDRDGDGDDPTETIPAGTATPGAGPLTPSPIDVPYAAEFDTVLDVVEQGATPDGSESISPLLQRLAGDDVLLSFPPGRYLLDPIDLEGISNFGLAAVSDERPVFVPTHDCVDSKPFVNLEGMESLLIDGIDIDFRANGAGGAVHVISNGDFTIRNVHITGSCDPQISFIRFDVKDPDGIGLVENLSLENPLDEHARLTGAFVGEPHAGEITFRDCTITGLTDNGLYASAPGTPAGHNGIVHVEGGTYRNNNVANVRLGSSGSTARDVTIEVDTVPPHPLEVNARGIRLRGQDGQLIEGCRIRYGPKAGFSFGGIVLHHANGAATLRDNHITIDANPTPAVRALIPEKLRNAGLIMENLEIDGTADGGAAIVLDERNGSVIRGCRITHPSADRGGLHLEDMENCRVIDSHIEVGGPPVKLINARLTLDNTTFARPGDDGPDPVTIGEDSPVVWDSNDPEVGDATGLPWGEST